MRSVLPAECRPPAAQGDVYRALQSRPRCIGLIDGYFDGAASVWHKEVLWALSEGVTVLGASSMGALRAAELSEFGMIGIGRIFEAYSSGIIEDDDEVAVVHGPAELGYVPLSEPMVNIRATLEHAVSKGILSAEQSAEMCLLSKSVDYPQRTWEQIQGLARANNIFEQDEKRFSEWLAGNRIDQKKQDALELLETMKQMLSKPHTLEQKPFEFEHTLLWQQGTTCWSRTQQDVHNMREVLDELMFTDQQYAVRQRALARKFAIERAFEEKLEISPAERREINKTFREKLGLLKAADLRNWLHSNDLNEDELKELLVEEFCVALLMRDTADVFDAHALGVLKLEGAYEALAERARHKAGIIQDVGSREVGLEDLDLAAEDLEEWYFASRPDFAGFGSLDNFITAHGLQSKDDFYTILAREHLYLRELETKA